MKDTYLGTEIAKIPSDYLKYEKGKDLKKIIARINWISLNQFIFINDEGIEKLIEFNEDSKQFKEIAFNVRPLF